MNIFNFTDLFDLRIELREQYPEQVDDLYATVVRHPEFQSINLLPETIRKKLIFQTTKWYDSNSHLLSNEERALFLKILTYLKMKPKPLKQFDLLDLRKDLASFITHYDSYSNVSYRDVYPAEFVEWMQSI